MGDNNENILSDVKNQIGIESDDNAFDKHIIPAINAVFLILKRMGVGPSEGFSITPNGYEQWTDFMADSTELEAVKAYIALKVGLMFDPPTSTALMEAKKENIRELEWTLNFSEDVLADSEEG